MLQTQPKESIEELQLIKNCLLYARVSTERQVVEGHSLNDQVERLVKFARDKSWHILEVYKDEGKSACSTAGRPEFTRMLERCETDSDVNAVLLEETDRFARNAQDHLAVKALLKKHNVELIATQQPNFGDDPVGNFVDLVMAGANQLQREITGVKTKRTMIALAEKGFQPGPAVLGYVNSFKKGVSWQIDPERVYFIKEIFRRFNTGLSSSIYILEQELYAEGLRTRQGKKLYSSQIHRILTDIRYAGKVLYMGKIYDGQHEPLITMEDIKKSKATLERHNNGADRSRKHDWLLAGVAHCKTSGDLMTGEQHTKKNGRVYRSYRCLGPKHGDHPCNEPYARASVIEEQFEEHIASIKFTERALEGIGTELRNVMRDQGKDTPTQIKSLEGRKVAVERKMDALEDQMFAKIVPQDRIEQKYVPLRDELKAIEADLAKLKRPSANLDDKKIEVIISFLRDMPKLWGAFNPQEKKQFMRWFVKTVWVQKKQLVGIDYTDGFQDCIDRDLVRIKMNWLPGEDSNL